jgi:hypothetical protein
MAPSELLISQGFPVNKVWSYGQACCSFAVSERFDQHRTHACNQAGNSMHVCVVGSVIIHSLIFGCDNTNA